MLLEDRERGKRYYINAELGRGTYGKCYLSTDIETGTQIACKQIKHLREFQSEANIHSKLDNKHVVKFISSFITDGVGYITMELCTKGSLEGLLRARTFLTNAEVKLIIKQVVTGLDYLHNNLIVHRDIKLLNLLISEELDIKIADFGLAHQMKSRDDMRGSFCGTNNYVAPEVIDGIGYSFAADIWAVGCVFYTLLIGKEPFWGLTQEATLRNISRISFAKSRLSPLAYNFLKTVFVLNPEDRPTASSILNHAYFSSGFYINTLPDTVFFGPPKMSKQRKITIKKPQPLADCTNFRHDKNVNPEAAIHLEAEKRLGLNNSYAKKLRPRNKHLMENVKVFCDKENIGMGIKVASRGGKEVCNDYTTMLTPRNHQTTIKNDAKKFRFKVFNDANESSDDEDTRYEFVSHAIERQLLNTTQKLLELKDTEDISKMKSEKSSFLCVTRWAEMDSGILAYSLSDGSLGINMGNREDHFYRYPGGTIKYFQKETTWTFVKDEIPKGLERFVTWTDEIRGLLMGLKRSGPSICFKQPVTVPTWKYFRNIDNSEKPTTVFLATNGFCQVNLPTHEKFILNAKEDIIATWTSNEAQIFSLKKVQKNGLPKGVREKLAFVLRILREVIPENLQ